MAKVSLRLIGAARCRGLSVTFHRAVDMTPDPAAAFAEVLKLGVDRVLTSGGANTAAEGATVITDFVIAAAAAAGPSARPAVSVMIGAGVTEDNVASIVAQTGVLEIHGSFRSPEQCRTKYRRDGVFMGGSKLNDAASEYTVK